MLMLVSGVAMWGREGEGQRLTHALRVFRLLACLWVVLADHTAGLRPSWDLGLIYCSELTARLIQHKFGLPEAVVVPLPLAEPTLLPLDNEGCQTMTVTALEAHHCPGAVMFLFEGYFGRILCTGDMRCVMPVFHRPPMCAFLTVIARRWQVP
jgi:hypothetical protein